MSETAKGKTEEPGASKARSFFAFNRSPDASRLLSVLFIFVALAVAASLALDGLMSRQRLSQIPQQIETAQSLDTTAGADIARLTQRTALLEREIADLHTRAAAEKTRADALASRVERLEALLVPEDQPKPDTLVTGAIDPDETAPAGRNREVPSLSQTHFAIALGLYQSRDDAGAAWLRFRRAHQDIAGTLEPRILTSGGNEQTLRYRLLAGPYAHVAAAARECARLARTGQTCAAQRFHGELLKVAGLIDPSGENGTLPGPASHSATVKAILANPPVPRPKPELIR